MTTECIQKELQFQDHFKRKTIVTNDGDITSSDGGVLLLREIERKYKIIKRLSSCFADKRNPKKIEHELCSLLTQRIFGLCQGYEDLNDHDEWRKDPLVGIACNKEQDEYAAGKSTLNRLELGKEVTPEYGERYNRIDWVEEKIEGLLIDLFLEVYKKTKEPIILDFDATDDPLHGNQEGRFFHGYYDSYCYLPLYVFCGEFPLVAKLRTSNRDASDGSVEILETIVGKIRKKYPEAAILVRGDSGFCREKIMRYCEENKIFYLFGMARNSRLKHAIGGSMREAFLKSKATGKGERVFTELMYKTRTSWSRSRRVVAKAEYLPKGENPRFIVTNLPKEDYPPQELYENVYCARGDMENRIKEQQMYLFADRTSTSWMSSNQLRLWFSTLAYLFLCILRTQTLEGTQWRKYQACTIRLKILKVAAQVSYSVRRVKIRLPRSFPYWEIWLKVHQNLQAA
jgi:hypothetical protein